MQLGKYDLAIKDAEKSLKINEYHQRALDRLIYCHKLKGDYAMALEYVLTGEKTHKDTDYSIMKEKLQKKLEPTTN